jgi:hypothetical protein
MSTTSEAGGTGRREAVSQVVAPLVAGLLLLVTLLVLVGTAIHDPRPHDIAVGLVGPAPATQQISSAFAANAPGTFSFTTFSTEADAMAAVDSRTVDGVLVVGSAAPKLIVAGAAGDASVGVMTAAFTNAFKAQGAAPQVQTVHPFVAGDAHGLILFFVVVAVIISTLVAQAAFASMSAAANPAARVGVIAAFAVLSGLTAMGTASWIVGDLGAGFWPATGLVILSSAAVGSVVAGSARLLGTPGIALAALVMVLFDLVSSGGPAGSQLLPDFYRALSPWMPAPQLFDALRGALYFDSAGVTTPILVMSGWLVAGLVMLGLGELVGSRRGTTAVRVAPAH